MSKKNYGWDVLLFSSCYSDYDYNFYLDFCRDNDITPAEEGSDKYFEWVSRQIEDEWDDIEYSLSHFPAYDNIVVVEGTLGLWYGTREIEPTEFDCVIKAINECMRGAEDVEIRYCKGFITVTAIHHDGRNQFTIRPRDRRRKLPYLFG